MSLQSTAETVAEIVAHLGGFSVEGTRVDLGNGNSLVFAADGNGDGDVEWYRGDVLAESTFCFFEDFQELMEIAAGSIADYSGPVPKVAEDIGPTRVVVVQKMWLTESAIEVPVDMSVEDMLEAAKAEALEMEFCTWEGTTLTVEDTDEELFNSN